MDWTQVLVIILANLGVMLPMFFWLRSEANADRRDMWQGIKSMQDTIHEEMKDFHGRLCAIEERNKSK